MNPFAARRARRVAAINQGIDAYLAERAPVHEAEIALVLERNQREFARAKAWRDRRERSQRLRKARA